MLQPGRVWGRRSESRRRLLADSLLEDFRRSLKLYSNRSCTRFGGIRPKWKRYLTSRTYTKTLNPLYISLAILRGAALLTRHSQCCGKVLAEGFLLRICSEKIPGSPPYGKSTPSLLFCRKRSNVTSA